MNDALQRTLDAIDSATADVCGWCQATLTDTAYSRIYCSQDHQARWQAAQAGVDPDPDLLDHDWPMFAVRSRIAGQLSQRLRGAQVHVNGHEVHVLGVRIDHVYVDEAYPENAHRMLSGNWDFDPVAVGAVFPQAVQQAMNIQLARIRADETASAITSEHDRVHPSCC